MSKKNKYSNLLLTIFITGSAFFVNYGINMILVPFITERVGSEAYGFVSLSKEFAQYAALITTAINSFAARYIAVEYHKKEINQANVYYSSVFYGDLFIGSGILLVAGIFILNLQKFLRIPVQLLLDVKCMFVIVFLDFWVITVFTVFSSVAYIENKLYLVNLFKGVGYVTEAVILVVLYLVFPAKIFYVGVGIISCTVISSVTNVWLSRKYTGQLQIRWKYFSIRAVKRLILDGIWSSVSSVGKILNQGLDLVVCNLMLDSLQMSQLAVAKTIDSIAHAMYLYLAQVFHPIFLKSYAKSDRKSLLRELKFSMKVCGLFSNLVFAGFVGVGLAFCKIWIPNQDCELIYRLTVLTLITGLFIGPLSPLYYIYVLTVKRAFPSIVVCVGGMANVLGMYFLITYTNLGIYSIVLTTLVIESVIAYITNPLYMAHVLKVPWYTFYPGLIRNLLSGIIMAGVFRLMIRGCEPGSWIGVGIWVIVFDGVGSVIHSLIVCGREDWERIRAVVKRRIN